MDVDEAAIVLLGYKVRDLNVRESRNKGEFVVATIYGGVPEPETVTGALGVTPAVVRSALEAYDDALFPTMEHSTDHQHNSYFSKHRTVIRSSMQYL